MSKSLSCNKLVIFDCDGVLVDSEHISNQALVDSLTEIEIELTLEEAMRNFRGRNLAECFAEIQTTYNCALPPSFETSFRQRRSKYFESDLRPIDGVAEALRMIPLAKCVASNGPIQMIKRNLEIAGLLHHFDGNVYSAYTIQKWKPEPDLFLHACRDMGYVPSDCIVVEDSESGVTAAQAGGFEVLAYRLPLAAYHPAIPFDDMAELPRLIEQFAKG